MPCLVIAFPCTVQLVTDYLYHRLFIP